jgi:hypothetical protein
MNGSTREQDGAWILAVGLALATSALGCAKDEAQPDDAADSGRGSPRGDGAGLGGTSAGAGRGSAGNAGGTSSGQAGSRAGEGGGAAGRGAAGRGEAGNGEAGQPSGGSDAEVDAGQAGTPGACDPRALEHAHDSMAAMHVPQSLPASDYNSSPPSSGPHCAQWGQYTVFADPPLPACNFLHNLEHGAIALLYNCPNGCDELVQQLAQVMQDAPADPDCGMAKRLLLTPYAEMDATIAAAAWGYTFTAECLDDAARTALLDFITAHQGSAGDAPEATVCSGGSVAP